MTTRAIFLLSLFAALWACGGLFLLHATPLADSVPILLSLGLLVLGHRAIAWLPDRSPPSSAASRASSSPGRRSRWSAWSSRSTS